jgi:glycosyltransferase involved in cell wall biosynthesis
MRILYLSSSKLISDTANAVHVTRMCQAFAANGHDVMLASLKGNGTDEEVFKYFGISTRYPLYRHDENDDLFVRSLWTVRNQVSWIRIGGLPSILYGYRVLRPRSRGTLLDLVYARNLDWLFSMPSAIPFIAESHRPPRNVLERAMERNLYRRPGFRRLVVISQSLKRLYTGIFPCLGDRILVAHDAADDPGEISLHRDSNCFNVGYVGHLYKGRGTEIIRALARQFPDVKFHLVGGTADDRTRFVATGLSKNVILHGHRPPAELSTFFPMFDVVLAPYERKVAVGGGKGDTAAYMSPLKIFEYMSWGKAILCSDIPVLREVLDHDRNAILVPPDDLEAWMAALKMLIDDPGRRQRVGVTARRDFIKSHSWNQRAQEVLKGIEETGASSQIGAIARGSVRKC